MGNNHESLTIKQSNMRTLTINKWVDGKEKPETIKKLRIKDYDDEAEMKDTFRKLANDYLYDGWELDYINHLWNYHFRKEGEQFALYMFEKDE